MMEPSEIVAHALEAQSKARAPYSRYQVGAAVLTGGGIVYSGGNIESGAYSTTICAERVAIFSAIAAGESDFAALAVISPDGGPPCGACLQVIHEQCGNIPIHIASNNGQAIDSVTTRDLLPKPFTFHGN